VSSPALPDGRWPSAWPALWRPVRDRAVFVGATVLLALVGIAFLGDLRLGWWVAFLPLVLLVGPVSRPARVRRRFERAAAQGRLDVQRRGHGWRLLPPGRSGNVVVLVSYDGELTYVDLRDRGNKQGDWAAPSGLSG